VHHQKIISSEQWNVSEDDGHSFMLSAFLSHVFTFNVEQMLTPAKLAGGNQHASTTAKLYFH